MAASKPRPQSAACPTGGKQPRPISAPALVRSPNAPAAAPAAAAPAEAPQRRRFAPGPSRGPGRSALPEKSELQPPGALHLTAAGLPDRETKQLYTLHALLNPPDAEDEKAAFLAAAEGEAMVVLEAARAESPAPEEAEGGKKKGKQSAKEKAAEEEAKAAKLREAQERADEIRSRALGEITERLANRVNWVERMEERALPYEWTPLIYASRHGTCEDMVTLLQYGANVHARDLHGCTALHKAAHVGRAEGVAKIKALVAAGADLEAADKCGRTALHVAALNEQIEAIKYLSRLGASMGVAVQMARDGPLKDGDTPIEAARQAGLQVSVDVLKPWQMRRKKLTGGDTRLVPANTPYWVPGPFAPRRFNVNGTWEPPDVNAHHH